jgi:hypothetical protein
LALTEKSAFFHSNWLPLKTAANHSMKWLTLLMLALKRMVELSSISCNPYSETTLQKYSMVTTLLMFGSLKSISFLPINPYSSNTSKNVRW